VSGESYADATAAAYLAGSPLVGGGPILLTARGVLPEATRQTIADLGIRRVYVLGGTAAVSDDVVARLRSLTSTAPGGGPLEVTVIAGADRYSTARLAAAAATREAVGTLDVDGDAHLDPLRTAILCAGGQFPDALASGPLAYAGTESESDRGNGLGFPLLLTPSDRLGSEAERALRDLRIDQVIVIGGPAAVSETVTDQLGALGRRVVRLAGDDRTETASEVAAFAVAADGLGWGHGHDRIHLATSLDFPDALAVAVLGGERTTPTLLSTSRTTLGPATSARVAALASAQVELRLIGGTAVLDDALADAIATLLTH
jgi:putative cell wall-binding protein